jgi:hypothetical protein
MNALIRLLSAGIIFAAYLSAADAATPLTWNFSAAAPPSTLPGAWAQEAQFGAWAVGPSQSAFGSGNVLAATFNPPSTKILYYADDISSLETALLFVPDYISKVEATSPSDFSSKLAGGNYNLAIFLQQFDFGASYDSAFTSLAQYIAGGGRAIASDASDTASHISAFGASFSSNVDENTFTITDSRLAPFVTSPLTLNTNTTGLIATTGVSAATFSGSGNAAIVLGNNGRTAFNAFPANTFASVNDRNQLLYNEIDAIMNPALGSGSDFPPQPQIRVDSLTPAFRITDRENAVLNMDYKVNFSAEGASQDALDITLVKENALGQLVDVAALWTYFFGGSPPQFPIRLADLDDFGQIQNNTTYRLRIRVSDGDIDLTSLHRIEVDNFSLSDAELEGDYAANQLVDAGDYVAWRNLNINGPAGYTAWRANFGADARSIGSASGAGAEVPEPSIFTLTLAAIVSLCLGRGSHRFKDSLRRH